MSDKTESDRIRFPSVQGELNHARKPALLGDDTGVNYTGATIKADEHKKHQLLDSKHGHGKEGHSAAKSQHNLGSGFTDASLTIQEQTPSKLSEGSEYDQSGHKSADVSELHMLKSPGTLKSIQPSDMSDLKGAQSTISVPGDQLNMSKPGKPGPTNVTVNNNNDEDDIYGSANAAVSSVTYDAKELQNYQQSLLSDFRTEFQDGLTAIDNIPKGTLLLSAICACLDDDGPQKKLVKRGILDAIKGFLRLDDNTLLDDGQKIKLIENMMFLLIERDPAVTRRMYEWFFGEADEDNNYTLEGKEHVVRYIESAFKTIFETFKPEDPKSASSPLKMLQNFYMDHDRSIDLTIRGISLPIIKFIYFRGIKNTDETIREEILKSGLRFLASVGSHFHYIVEEISKAIPDLNESELINYCGIIRFVKDCFGNPDLQISNLQVEVQLLKGLTSFLLKVKISDLVDTYINNDTDRIKLTQEVLELFTEILDYLYEQEHKWSQKELKTMIGSMPEIVSALENFEKEFMELCKTLSTFKVEDDFITFKDINGDEQTLREELPQLVIKAVSFTVQSVVKMQKVIYSARTASLNTYPAWIKSLVNCIKSNEPNICKISIEGLIYVISSERKEEIFTKLREMIHMQASSILTDPRPHKQSRHQHSRVQSTNEAAVQLRRLPDEEVNE